MCTSWHQLDVKCYVNFKAQKFRFEKILYIWLGRRRWVFYWEIFLQKYKKTLYEHTERCSVNCYWKVLCKKRYCEVLCKTTQMCSAKRLKGVLQKNWYVFCKNTERYFAQILTGVSQNYWGEFHTLKMNIFPVKAQGLDLFPVTSWPPTLGWQEIIIIY